NTTEIIAQTAALFFEGDIKTPLVKFKGGHYTLNFTARGSKAWDEYSILRVDYRELDENNYLLLKKSAYVNLTATMEHYQIPFQTTNTTQSAIGRLEISFVNDDLEPGGKKDRNAWVKEIKIESK
ncbi:MAG: hypothetical protein GY757_50580, partial [bacterium]|nr:hypothetical protein [bacterium]